MKTLFVKIGRWISVACLVFLAVSILPGCRKETPGAGPEYVFKLNHLANTDHVWHKSALFFAERIKTLSGGRIEVKVYPNEQLGNEIDTINSIRAGTVDMTITGESMQNWTSLAGLCAVPYAITDSQHLTRAVDGPVGKQIEEAIRSKIGLRPIAWFQRGARNLTSNRPIRHPDDLQGIILRVPNVPLFIQTWQHLGAKPTPMAFGEVFTALQQGTVQAQENPYALILSAGFYEVQKYCNQTEHVIGWVYVVLGEKQYQALPPDLQKAVLQAGREMQQYHQQIFEQAQAELVEKLKQHGMTFVEVDKEAFRQKASQAVLSALTEEQRDLYLQMIEKP
ncbi:MAG: TRAP transporter substrate-binding protein [Sedimentisphaerales bacterium]|nr:TRAP transporter substrate-binding protein [Sedimentisphaerales bacterium]